MLLYQWRSLKLTHPKPIWYSVVWASPISNYCCHCLYQSVSFKLYIISSTWASIRGIYIGSDFFPHWCSHSISINFSSNIPMWHSIKEASLCSYFFPQYLYQWIPPDFDSVWCYICNIQNFTIFCSRHCTLKVVIIDTLKGYILRHRIWSFLTPSFLLSVALVANTSPSWPSRLKTLFPSEITSVSPSPGPAPSRLTWLSSSKDPLDRIGPTHFSTPTFILSITTARPFINPTAYPFMVQNSNIVAVSAPSPRTYTFSSSHIMYSWPSTAISVSNTSRTTRTLPTDPLLNPSLLPSVYTKEFPVLHQAVQRLLIS